MNHFVGQPVRKFLVKVFTVFEKVSPLRRVVLGSAFILVVASGCGSGSGGVLEAIQATQTMAAMIEQAVGSTLESSMASPTPTLTATVPIDATLINAPAAANACSDALGCVTYGPGDPIRIATALIISGPAAKLGLDAQYGVEIATEFKGQVLGHPIELQREDEKCNGAGGREAAQKIVSDASIVAIIGTSCSGAAVGMLPIVSEAGFVMVSPSNTAPSLTDPAQAWQPGYLRTSHNDKVQSVAMADFAYNVLGLHTAATIHDGDPYTEALANSFRESFEALGGTITTFTAVTKGQTDMTAVLTDVAASGPPEFIYYPVFTAECALLTKQAKEVAGLENTVLSAADGCFSDAAAEAIGDAGEGMYFSGPDISFSGDLYTRFKEAYMENYGSEPLSVFHAHAFDATNMIFACIEEVADVEDDGTIHIGRQALRDCLYATSGFDGITGTLTCNEFGDCADPKISVSQLQGGEYVRIWP